MLEMRTLGSINRHRHAEAGGIGLYSMSPLSHSANCYLASPFGEHQQPQEPLLGVVEEEEEPPFSACNGGLFCIIQFGRCHCASLAAVNQDS